MTWRRAATHVHRTATCGTGGWYPSAIPVRLSEVQTRVWQGAYTDCDGVAARQVLVRCGATRGGRGLAPAGKVTVKRALNKCHGDD